MRHFRHVCVILGVLCGTNALAGHDIVNTADFYTGVAAALLGCALAWVILDLMRD